MGSPALSVQAKFLAATKATDGALARYSCLSLWRLVDFDELAPPQVVVPHGRRRTIPGIDIYRTRRELRVLRLDGIPTTPDFRWPHLNLCVEADGAQYHEHPLARQDDAAKQARLEAHGERVSRVIWDQTTLEPQQTLMRLQTAGAPLRESTGTARAPTG